MVSTNIDSTGDGAWSVAVQPDSKVVAVGLTGESSSTGTEHIAVVRYNADGSLDSTFGSGGVFIDPFGPNVIWQEVYHQAVAIQADGKIVIAGQQTRAVTTKSGKKTVTNDYTDWLILRLNPTAPSTPPSATAARWSQVSARTTGPPPSRSRSSRRTARSWWRAGRTRRRPVATASSP